ncbi:MAG: Mur ligase family protein, partial [Alphaproteobacteria bacterium]
MKNNIDIDISKYIGISTDSRDIKEGYIYAAIKGSHFNGEDFIEESVSQGANLVLINHDSTYDKPCPTPILKVENIRLAVSYLASLLYPKQPSNIVAITGTNGKTSNAYFYNQFAELLGYKSACIGTLGLISSHKTFHQSKDILTSPASITMHKMLDSLASDNINHVAIEASSHGLDQHRIDCVRIKAAAFTNFTQDHLDYHHDMDSYFKAKMRLFTEVMINGAAVINADMPEFDNIVKLIGSRNKIVSYGQNGAEYKLIAFGDQHIEFEAYGKRFKSKIGLNGYFQAQNLLSSIALCVATGLKIEDLVSVIPQIQAAPGRLEQVAETRGAKIFIDYAHTPDALEKALSNLRAECKGK